MKACVVGLGKVGLPLAVQAASRGIEVVGADQSESLVQSVNSGLPPFEGEEALERRLRSVVGRGYLRATTSTTDAVRHVQYVVIVVPLLVDGSPPSPDYSSVDSAVAEIGMALQAGQTVICETTVPVGTTRNRVGPALAQLSRLTMGEDFYLAYSPERVSSGTVFRDLSIYPKIIGGVNKKSADMASRFYERALEFTDRPDLERVNGVWDLGTSEAAEFAKLAETTYRDVNIALANEFAVHAEDLGLDVQAVIEAANSQPYSHIHRPGISVGGHCIPVYPYLYLDRDDSALLPALSRTINSMQPQRAVDRLADSLGGLDGLRVAILGLCYRGGVREDTLSGTPQLAQLIKDAGGSPLIHDPLYSDRELERRGFDPYSYGEQVDAVVIHTDHREYRDLTPSQVPGCRAVLDGRRIVGKSQWLSSEANFMVIGNGTSP